MKFGALLRGAAVEEPELQALFTCGHSVIFVLDGGSVAFKGSSAILCLVLRPSLDCAAQAAIYLRQHLHVKTRSTYWNLIVV